MHFKSLRLQNCYSWVAVIITVKSITFCTFFAPKHCLLCPTMSDYENTVYALYNHEEGEEQVLDEQETKESSPIRRKLKKIKQKKTKYKQTIGTANIVLQESEPEPEVGVKDKVEPQLELAGTSTLPIGIESTQKAGEARRLLEEGLRANGPDEDDKTEYERQEMIRNAFQCAINARLSQENEGYQDVENKIALNAEKGIAAAVEVRRMLSSRPVDDGDDDISLTESLIGDDDSVELMNRDTKNTSGSFGKGDNAYPLIESLVEDDGSVELMEQNGNTPSGAFANEVNKYSWEARNCLESIIWPDYDPKMKSRRSLTGIRVMASGLEREMSIIGVDEEVKVDILRISSYSENLAKPKDFSSSRKQKVRSLRRKKEEKQKATAGIVAGAALIGTSRISTKKQECETGESIQYFKAKVVDEKEEEEPSLDQYECERIRAIEERTNSMLKTALCFDRTGSLSSWDGVPLHLDAPQIGVPKQKKNSNDEKESAVQSLLVEPPRNADALKPAFIVTPKEDPDLLMSNTWDMVLAEGQTLLEEENKAGLNPDLDQCLNDGNEATDIEVNTKMVNKKGWGFRKKGKYENEITTETSFGMNITDDKSSSNDNSPSRNVSSLQKNVTTFSEGGKEEVGGSCLKIGGLVSKSDLREVPLLTINSCERARSYDMENIESAPLSLEMFAPYEIDLDAVEHTEINYKEVTKISKGRWSKFGKGNKTKNKSFKV